jgi:hypothetical protein
MLDRTKPYSGIYGHFHGARFEQDGKYYAADGKEVIINPGVVKTDVTTVADVGFDVEKATKADLLNFAYNRYGQRLDNRRSVEAIRAQVKYLME